MKCMLLMNCSRNGHDQYSSWSKKVLQANHAFMPAFGSKLSAAGETVGAEGLASPQQARLVRADRDGKPITDEVFRDGRNFPPGIGSGR